MAWGDQITYILQNYGRKLRCDQSPIFKWIFYRHIYQKSAIFACIYTNKKCCTDRIYWSIMMKIPMNTPYRCTKRNQRGNLSRTTNYIFFEFFKKKKNKKNFRLLSKLSLIFALGSWFFQRMCSQLAQITPESFISLKQLWDFWRI